MKKLFFLVFLFYCVDLYPQSTQDQVNQLKKELKELKERVEKNSSDKDDSVKILRLKAIKDIPVYKHLGGGSWLFPNQNYQDLKTPVDIKKVRLVIKEGYIVEVQVYADGGDGEKLFSNANAPIAVTTKRFNGGDKFSYKNNGKDEYIYLSSFLELENLKSYTPSDITLVLDPKEPKKILYRGVGINSLFDLRLYSDALGVFGGENNGIVQTEAYFRQVIPRNNIRNLGITLFNAFEFNLVASRFDKADNFTDSTEFNRSSLFQKSWLNANVGATLISGWLANKSLSSFYIDFGGGISVSKVRLLTDTSNVVLSNLFLEPGLDFKVADNIGSEISTKIIWQYSPQTDYENQTIERIFIRPTFSIFWNPSGNQSSRIFGRFTYTMDTREQNRSFVQVQLGYSLMLSNLLKE